MPPSSLSVIARGDLYPSAQAYLEGLPAGWASHPTCEVSVELSRGLRERGALDGLDELTAFLDDADTGWVPEVAFTAVLLAVKDVRFVGANPEQAMVAWMEMLNRRVVVSPAGPIFDGPADAILHAPMVWGRFHRGTEMEVRPVSPHRADVLLRHPAGLWPPLVHAWRTRTFLAALASEGATQPTGTHRETTEGTLYELTW